MIAPPRPLFLPIVFSLGARVENISLRNFLTNPTKISNALRQIRTHLRRDGVTCYFDPYLEAEALGGVFDWARSPPPVAPLAATIARWRIPRRPLLPRRSREKPARPRRSRSHPSPQTSRARRFLCCWPASPAHSPSPRNSRDIEHTNPPASIRRRCRVGIWPPTVTQIAAHTRGSRRERNPHPRGISPILPRTLRRLGRAPRASNQHRALLRSSPSFS